MSDKGNSLGTACTGRVDRGLITEVSPSGSRSRLSELPKPIQTRDFRFMDLHLVSSPRLVLTAYFCNPAEFKVLCVKFHVWLQATGMLMTSRCW